MSATITASHLSKPAYIYIRQSTLAQVRQHQESTERQYALKDKAQAMGWPLSSIRVLDGDQGMSGAQSAGRQDFKTLVADVSMGQVGAVFALEVSRLARSNVDWLRLLELCALTHTLVIDADGGYDPADFNDGLLLGLKGTMAQAELHFLRGRLQGGKLNKARKGELRFPLPVGFCYDDQGRIVADADDEVRGAVQLVFTLFRETTDPSEQIPGISELTPEDVLLGLYERQVARNADAAIAADLFEPGKECVAFRDSNEMLAAWEKIAAAPSEFDQVVESGRRRAMADHTWEKRMERILGLAKERFDLPW